MRANDTTVEARDIGVYVENIPAEMKTYNAYVCWRYEVRDVKETKVPYDALTGRRDSSTDSRTWRSFEEAVAALEIGGYDGLGFVLSTGDPFCAVDLDACRDPQTGKVEAWAEDLIAASGGYVEVSPSGGGVHIIVKGKAPNRKRGNVECYSAERFITMSGEVLG